MTAYRFEFGQQSGRTEAEIAMAAAQNARQMVLNRDPKVTSLEEAVAKLDALSASYAAALPASVADRAALHEQIDALTAAVAGIKAVTVPTVSAASALVTGSLLAGAVRDVVVNLTPAMPDANYTATATLNGTAGLLGTTVLRGITAKTAGSVTVTIANTGLSLLASGTVTVSVVAVR